MGFSHLDYNAVYSVPTRRRRPKDRSGMTSHGPQFAFAALDTCRCESWETRLRSVMSRRVFVVC
jgi:hypothetical protein